MEYSIVSPSPIYACKHCGGKLIYQPSQVQYWCQQCRLAFSVQQVVKGGNK